MSQKDVALENAYQYLGVCPSDPNEKIKHAYRQLARKLHPDKPGGNAEDFLYLQYCVEIIRNARDMV